MGGQFRSVYMTMGAYDLVMIYDAPDDAVAARFTLMLGQARQCAHHVAEGVPRGGIPPDRQLAALICPSL